MVLALLMANALATPTAAHADHMSANIGTGVATGDVVFGTGSYIPSVEEGGCKSGNTFTLANATANAVALNTAFTGFVGDVDDLAIGGRGAAGPNVCEDVNAGSGTLEIWASGTGPTGSTLVCGTADAPMIGTFARVGSVVEVNVNGTCTINNYATDQVNFIARLEIRATDDDPDDNRIPGINAQVKGGTFVGPFTILPKPPN